MTRNDMVRKLCLGLIITTAALMAAEGAAVAAPVLKISSVTPDNVTAGKDLPMWINMLNAGKTPTDTLDGTLTIKTTFPVGITPVGWTNDSFNMPDPVCTIAGQETECTIDVTGVVPGIQMRVRVDTTVDAGASGLLSGGQIEVSGGGVADSFTEPLKMIAAPIGPFALKPFGVDLAPTLTGSSSAQAGSDPMEIDTVLSSFAEAKTTFDYPIGVTNVIAPPEQLRDVVVHVPPGLVGNPTATGIRCTPSQLTSQAKVGQAQFPIGVPACPPDSQVGLAQLNTGDIVPVYNVEPPVGSPAAFGFFYNSIVITLLAKLRPDDNGIDIITEKNASSVPLPRIEVTLWGVPSDPSHDPLRGVCLLAGHGYNSSMGDCSLRTRSDVPFLRTPTSCSGNPLSWIVDVDTYQNVGNFLHSQSTTPAMQDCQRNPFDPGFGLTPSTLAPHAASGVDATVQLNQDSSTTGVAPADLKTASVTLPEGLTINPSSADGLAACTDAELRLKQDGPAQCPDASKLGTVTLNTPLLDHPVGGTVYLRTQNSDDPMSGELFRIAIEIRSDRDGLAIKLPGSIKANPISDDPKSGQLTTVFDALPQLPFDSMTLHFKQGPRAPLASPGTCGTKTTSVDLLSWGDAPRHLETSFTTTGCKPAQFAPTWKAGVENPVAGASSPLNVSLDRNDDDSEFHGLTVNTPKGLLARVKDAQQCANDAANTGNCPEGSLIGHATVGAGVGSNPYFVTNGRVYLTGPYKGAPFGLAVAVDAVAGPFNLGTVVVRQAVNIDPITAQLSVVSDSFPTIQKGVPLHVRSVRVAIDKPRFALAPTNCANQQLGATATAVDGATAALSSRFQVGDCGALKLTPKLAIALTGKGQTTDDKHPGVHATLTQAAGQSNLKKVVVSLPLSLALDPDNAQALCEFTDGSKIDPTCPKGSIVGKAVARTPILAQPLSGPVYFVKNIRKDPKSGREIRTLPKLVIPLTGENGLRLNLTGTSDVVDNRLVTTFDNIPDAPVSDFTLDINGGKGGILVVSGTDICKATQVADQQIDGQNGKDADADVYLQTTACPLKILSKKTTKTSVAVKVGGLGAGKATVTGHGIKKTTKTITKSTVATITAKRTKGKPGKVTVSFDPTGPTKAHKTTK